MPRPDYSKLPPVLRGMTKQDVFDIMVKHLREQGEQAQDTRLGGCAYATSDGLACAVGALIPDGYYDPAFEGEFADDIVRGFGGSDELAEFAEDAQSTIHDDYGVLPGESRAFREFLEEAALTLADRHELVYTPPVN